ncbi:MAG: CoA-binding protein [Chloroflexi bacterium]|nr:CoA-binding protein [Chloroflexota bacterium]
METNIERILREARTIAVVGLSPKPDRPSFGVAEYLQQRGYRIIPVNPTVDQVLGEKSYPDLKSVPEKIDVVDIFRRPEDVPPVVEEAIQVGARAIWMQEGIINEAAAARARQAGRDRVMDRCMLKEHQRLSNPSR